MVRLLMSGTGPGASLQRVVLPRRGPDAVRPTDRESMPERLRALEAWLRGAVGLREFTLEPASGDASFRRYFRVAPSEGPSLIAMDAPPDREDCRPFVHVAGQLERLGLHVPHIHAASFDEGFLLIDDLGSRHYLEALSDGNADRLYGDALGALVIMQACGPREELPLYDSALLQQEMSLFTEWLVGRHLGIVLSDDERAMMASAFRALEENALLQPQVFVHRDYHSRNLMVTASPNPGILDFQDAVIGPVTYDLVSLLKDCYVRWDRGRVRGWAEGYFALAVQSGVLRGEDERGFMRWFDLMGMQRHLKAAGIFARLFRRDGKSGYLGDVPRTLGYIVEAAADYPEFAELGRFIEERVMPAFVSRDVPGT